MDPGPGLYKSGSHHSNRNEIFSRHFNRLNSIKVEQDSDEAIGKWGSVRGSLRGSLRSASFGLDRRRSAHTLGRFGSTNSVSVLDVIAAGGNIDMLPFYDIVVKNLSYKVTVKVKDQGTQEKVLLNRVNAEAHHGQILAIVGPSGSGKTTFLDALAGRVAKRSLEGDIFINRELVDDSFKRISGYVMQDDALFPMLTVRETLLYSARLRLPNTMHIAEKRTRVDNMIKQLGLIQCTDTRVGNDKIRGVSGGERRRVSIGSDLIHDPAVLFLDEPTSGLDSTSALSVMQNLHRMAQSGKRTVLLTIHQPSYRILETIDRVLVLGRGNVIYHGPHAGIKHYFDPVGRRMPEFVNVIEHALDTIGDFQRSPDGLDPLINLQEATKKIAEMEVVVPPPQELVEIGPEYANNFFKESFILSSRNLKNTLRTPELFISRAVMMIFVAVTVGTVFLRVKMDAIGEQERVSFIVFSLALLIFTSTEAIGVFIDERHVFIRETSRGAYRAASYVISGAIISVPFHFILAVLFSAPGYFIVGLVPTFRAFIFFALVVWLTISMANSFVCFVSGLVPNFTVGNSICSAVIAYFFLFAGFFIPRDQIPSRWIWLHYLSLFKYPFESLISNEFGNKKFKDTLWGNETSADVLRQNSSGEVHQGINVLVMILMFVGYRFFFWIVLKFFTKSIRS